MDNKTICETFLTKIVQGDYVGGFQGIQAICVIPELELEKLKIQTQTQLDMIKPRFGDILGFELATQDKINDTLEKFVYILKFQAVPIRFNFIFYKASNNYVLVSINWDDNIKELFA